MDKSVRHNAILDIINSQEIENQTELVEKLNNLGFVVTQATVSRDITELGLKKVKGLEKRHKYVKSLGLDGDERKMINLFKVTVKDILQAQNLVVVKTLAGNSGIIALTIDKLKIEEIVGSVAGDDTVIVVTKDNESAEITLNKLKELL